MDANHNDMNAQITDYEAYAALRTILYYAQKVLPQEETARGFRLLREISGVRGRIYLLGERSCGKTTVLRWLSDGAPADMPEVVEEPYEGAQELLPYDEIALRDTVIFVVRATQPFSMTEREKLIRLLKRGRMRRGVVLVNMLNLVDLEEREEILEYLKERVRTSLEEELQALEPEVRESVRPVCESLEWAVYEKQDETAKSRLRELLFSDAAVETSHIVPQVRLLISGWKQELSEREESLWESLQQSEKALRDMDAHHRLLESVWGYFLQKEEETPLLQCLIRAREDCLEGFADTFRDRMTEGLEQVVNEQQNSIAERLREEWDAKVPAEFGRVLGKKSWIMTLELRTVSIPEKKVKSTMAVQACTAVADRLLANYADVQASVDEIAASFVSRCREIVRCLPEYNEDMKILEEAVEIPVAFSMPQELAPNLQSLYGCADLQSLSRQVEDGISAYSGQYQEYKRRIIDLAAEKDRRRENDFDQILNEVPAVFFAWPAPLTVDWKNGDLYGSRLPAAAAKIMDGLRLLTDAWMQEVERRYRELLGERRRARTEFVMALNRERKRRETAAFEGKSAELARVITAEDICAEMGGSLTGRK